MDFNLKFNIESNGLDLTHNDHAVSIGSCFSEEISLKLDEAGFHVECNSFGTLFHPSAIYNVVHSSIQKSHLINSLNREDLSFSWDSSSSIYGNSEEELVVRVNEQRALFLSKIRNAKLFIVTFGTAWGYRNLKTDEIVGNCHKMPSDLFRKELVSTDLMLENWKSLIQELKIINPSLKFLFTVSPVRHKKDGLVQNNQSKARLIELVHSLVDAHENCLYFPAYEILIDELRDYRFYSKDLVHPNQLAVDYIWEQFKEASVSRKAVLLAEKVLRLKTTLNHKSLHPGSKQDLKRLEKAIIEKNQLILEYPSINWK